MSIMARKNKALTASEIIKRRRYNILTARGYRSTLTRVCVIVIAGWLILNYMLLLTQANGSDMFPTIKDGDLIIAYRLTTDYSKNDVVVYYVDGEEKIGRVVARAGDVVSIDDAGTLLVNGTVQTGEILYATYAHDGVSYPYTVPDGCVFILADYRTQAADSRDFGAVSLQNVKGKVITFLRRRSI